MEDVTDRALRCALVDPVPLSSLRRCSDFTSYFWAFLALPRIQSPTNE